LDILDKLNSPEPLLVLAPLAGYTDLPFRSVVKDFGADLTISEMISSNALVYNSKKTLKMLEKSPNETPYIVQIAGNSENIIKEAVAILNDFDFVDGIDLNCGCPASKVFNHGSGSSLLGDLNKLENILKTIKKHSTKKTLSAKIRIGIDEKIGCSIAKVCEYAGVDFLSVHGRTKKGAYKSAVDYDEIAKIKEQSKIPIIANGDITDNQKARYVLDKTKADGLMIGRGAIGKPWIFYQILNNIEDISCEIKKEVILKHFTAMINCFGNHGVIMFRKHLHTYSKGYQKSAIFRQTINNTEDAQTMKNIIVDFF